MRKAHELQNFYLRDKQSLKHKRPKRQFDKDFIFSRPFFQGKRINNVEAAGSGIILKNMQFLIVKGLKINSRLKEYCSEFWQRF